jgi:hypothetical protein
MIAIGETSRGGKAGHCRSCDDTRVTALDVTLRLLQT